MIRATTGNPPSKKLNDIMTQKRLPISGSHFWYSLNVNIMPFTDVITALSTCQNQTKEMPKYKEGIAISFKLLSKFS